MSATSEPKRESSTPSEGRKPRNKNYKLIYSGFILFILAWAIWTFVYSPAA